jgi:hypothetical protein
MTAPQADPPGEATKVAKPSRSQVRGTPLALANIASDRLHRLYRLWNERRGARRWPAHADLARDDLGFMHGTVTVIEVLREPLRFRLFALGPAIEELRGRGDEGKMVDEIEPPAYARLLLEHYTEAVTHGEPRFHLVQFIPGVRPSRFPLAYERAILPLSSDGAAIDRLLVASDWSETITAELRKFHETD